MAAAIASRAAGIEIAADVFTIALLVIEILLQVTFADSGFSPGALAPGADSSLPFHAPYPWRASPRAFAYQAKSYAWSSACRRLPHRISFRRGCPVWGLADACAPHVRSGCKARVPDTLR